MALSVRVHASSLLVTLLGAQALRTDMVHAEVEIPQDGRSSLNSSLNHLSASVRKSWQMMTAPCAKDMNAFFADLLSQCVSKHPREGVRCMDQVSQVFDGRHSDLAVPIEQHRRYERYDDQLSSWFVPLATTSQSKSKMLWAGFWDGENAEDGRTTETALFNFAKLVDHETVHPDTILGRLVDKYHVFRSCDGDPGAWRNSELTGGPLPHFWRAASEAFVWAMAKANQPSIPVMLNKDMYFYSPRNLWLSVFWQFEIPAIVNSHPYGHWCPKIVLVDLRGNCGKLRRLIQTKIDGVLPPGYPDRRFCGDLVCLPCGPGCKLDEEFASVLKTLLFTPGSSTEGSVP